MAVAPFRNLRSKWRLGEKPLNYRAPATPESADPGVIPVIMLPPPVAATPEVFIITGTAPTLSYAAVGFYEFDPGGFPGLYLEQVHVP